MHSHQLNSEFSLFIGIDQTGAVVPNSKLKSGEAKPLACTVFVRDAGAWKLHVFNEKRRALKLRNFSRSAFEDLLTSCGIAASRLMSSKTAIIADSVIGLPEAAWPKNQPAGADTLRKLFLKAATDKKARKGYGLRQAALFFDEVLETSAFTENVDEFLFPMRTCEEIVKANSVFRTQPYQKNIQCGTYRVWRDLGLYGSDWVHLRYFEKAKDFKHDRPILFEAYPSLLWREALKLQTRDRSQLESSLSIFEDLKLSGEEIEFLVKDADHADAAILSLGGRWLAQRNELVVGTFSKEEPLAKEGWIAGLK